MGWESIIKGKEVSDIREAYRDAVKIEQYRISDDAVYMPRKMYIPLSEVTSARTQRSQMNTTGCCGLSIPVHLVVLEYGSDKPARLTFEKEANALKALELIGKNI